MACWPRITFNFQSCRHIVAVYDTLIYIMPSSTPVYSPKKLAKSSFTNWQMAYPSILIGHVRYITILTWLRGFQNKISNLLSFFCPSRESDAQSKYTNMLKRNLLYLSASRFNIMIASNSKIADWSYKWLVFFKIGLIW